MLDQIRPLAKNGSLGHEARLSVRADIARIKTALAEERWKPGAIAIFSCSGRDLYEEVALPQAVRDRVLVDAAPYVRPMLTVLDEAAPGLRGAGGQGLGLRLGGLPGRDARAGEHPRPGAAAVRLHRSG